MGRINWKTSFCPLAACLTPQQRCFCGCRTDRCIRLAFSSFSAVCVMPMFIYRALLRLSWLWDTAKTKTHQLFCLSAYYDVCPGGVAQLPAALSAISGRLWHENFECQHFLTDLCLFVFLRGAADAKMAQATTWWRRTFHHLGWRGRKLMRHVVVKTRVYFLAQEHINSHLWGKTSSIRVKAAIKYSLHLEHRTLTLIF